MLHADVSESLQNICKDSAIFCRVYSGGHDDGNYLQEIDEHNHDVDQVGHVQAAY
jgi:hypothetical protein